MTATLREVLRTQIAFLFFRPISPDLRNRYGAYLAFVLVVTWAVGVGRYWDHPTAYGWQYAGLGSVAYVFVLAAILFLVVAPLRPANWSYGSVLVFVGLTSLPAALYAVPVERFLSPGAAMRANVWFLAIVAAWRVALLVRHLRVAARLRWFDVVIATLLPLSAIVVALGFLNLEQAAFSVMGGIREHTANDAAYGVVVALTFFSILAFPVTLAFYAVSVYRARRRTDVA